MAIIPVRDEAHWHELRAQNIGGSDVAAMLGISPYKSRWQLWMEKSGKLQAEDLSHNPHIQAGTFLESGIANWAAHRWGMILHKVTDYYTVDDVPGMGASLDYATADMRPVEIKWSATGHGWHYSADQIVEAPEQYLIQVQHQLACVNADGGWLIALIDNEPRRMFVPRHDGVIAAIKEGIASFWDSIKNDAEPAPDFSLDGGAVLKAMEYIPRAEVELGSDSSTLFRRYLEAAETAKLAEKTKDEIKTELLFLARAQLEKSNGNAEKAIVKCGEYKMSITTVAPNFGIEVTQEMVGTRINTRKGYQMVRVS